jgi:peroxiredoxin family protein
MNIRKAMTGYAIVLASGKLERLQAVGNIASIAAASEIPIDVFATMDGLEAFDEDRVATMDYEMGPIGEAMLANEGDEMALFTENISRAKDLGPIEVFACELSIDMLDKELVNYVDVFDDVLGVAGFLKRAKDKQVMFV